MGEVNITDNSKKIEEEFKKKILLAARAIGERAEGYAKTDCPVDTGRLRNSITNIVSGDKGHKYNYEDNNQNKYTYTINTPPKEESAVYIGTNVEYAPYVEYKDLNHKTGKAHFLKDAATEHGSEYERITETILKDDT